MLSCYFFTDFFSNFYSFPTGRRLLDTKVGFAQKAGLPNVIGAVDGTFIPIMAPLTNPDIYVCRKGFHAINVQAVVDHKARYIVIFSVLHFNLQQKMFLMAGYFSARFTYVL